MVGSVKTLTVGKMKKHLVVLLFFSSCLNNIETSNKTIWLSQEYYATGKVTFSHSDTLMYIDVSDLKEKCDIYKSYKKVGVWTIFDRNGEIVSKQTFKEDSLVNISQKLRQNIIIEIPPVSDTMKGLFLNNHKYP